MKTLFLPLLLVSILGSSCTRYAFQVTQLAYEGENQGSAPNVVEHNDLTITYQFWHEDGAITYSVQNHSDEMIILDFTRSSFIIGNRAIPYETGSIESNVELYDAPVNHPATYVGIVETPSLSSSKVGIPPKTEIIMDQVAIPIPLAPERLNGGTQKVNRGWTPPAEQQVLQHYLCYTVKTHDAEPVFISDSFRIESVQVMNRTAFNTFLLSQNADQNPMTSFLIKRDLENPDSEAASAIGMTMAILASTALITILIISNGDE